MHRPFSYKSNQLYQHGVTMIEAMISILLFAVGALGLVALQYSSIVGTGDNQQRTVAIWKAQELANRIKSNPSQIATYQSKIDNATLTSIGIDSDTKLFNCSDYSTTSRCADYVSTTGTSATNAVECSDADKVDFDIWDVFCEPNTGGAITGSSGSAVADGSAAITRLELALMPHSDGSGDSVIYMEWLSREGENTKGTDAINNIPTQLCGSTEDIDSRLDVYCLRFRP